MQRVLRPGSSRDVGETDRRGGREGGDAMSTRTSRLALANLWVAIVAFGVASAMALMQALSRAALELPWRTAKMYYLSVTAPGPLKALVSESFFIMSCGYVVAEC